MNEIEFRNYCYVIYIIYLVVGVLCCLSIVGAIIGIPFILGAMKFKDAKDMPMAQILPMKSSLFIWGIVFGIFTLPVGALTIIFAVKANSFLEAVAANNPNMQVPGAAQNMAGNSEVQGKNFGESVKDFSKKTVEGVKDTFGIKSKSQKLEELKKLYDGGTITKDEYDALRKKVLGI